MPLKIPIFIRTCCSIAASPGVPSPAAACPGIIQRFTFGMLLLGLAVLAALGTEMSYPSPCPVGVCSPHSGANLRAVVLNGLPRPRWLWPLNPPCCLQAGDWTPQCLAWGRSLHSSHLPLVPCVHSGASQMPLTVPFTPVVAFFFLRGLAVLSPPPGAFFRLCPYGSLPLFNTRPVCRYFKSPARSSCFFLRTVHLLCARPSVWVAC